MIRRDSLGYFAAGAACAILPPLEMPENVTLKSWELAEYPSLPKKLTPVMKIIASNGAIGGE